jgi:hypothetical protein
MKKVYNIKDLQRELGKGFTDSLPIKKLIGQHFRVEGAVDRTGQYGTFKVMKIILKGKPFDVLTRHKALVEVLALNKFPFEAGLALIKSKTKVKKGAKGRSYYAFTK